MIAILNVIMFRALIVALTLVGLCAMGGLDFSLVIWPITVVVLFTREILQDQ